jgi:hypothetical protein
MSAIKWKTGGFLDNFDAAAKHLGYDHIPLAFGLAKVDWPDPTVRDEFLRAITRITEGDLGAISSTPPA